MQSTGPLAHVSCPHRPHRPHSMTSWKHANMHLSCSVWPLRCPRTLTPWSTSHLDSRSPIHCIFMWFIHFTLWLMPVLYLVCSDWPIKIFQSQENDYLLLQHWQYELRQDEAITLFFFGGECKTIQPCYHCILVRFTGVCRYMTCTGPSSKSQ